MQQEECACGKKHVTVNCILLDVPDEDGEWWKNTPLCAECFTKIALANMPPDPDKYFWATLNHLRELQELPPITPTRIHYPHKNGAPEHYAYWSDDAFDALPLGYFGCEKCKESTRYCEKCFEIATSLSKNKPKYRPLENPYPRMSRKWREIEEKNSAQRQRIVEEWKANDCKKVMPEINAAEHHLHLTASGADNLTQIPLQASMFAEVSPATIGGR